MNLSIDFDDTYTRDPELWNGFIRLARSRGHHVYCVTARSADFADEVTEVLETIGQLIGYTNCIFTGGKAKRPFCFAMNINIQVWIDDMPEAIPQGMKHLFHDPD